MDKDTKTEVQKTPEVVEKKSSEVVVQSAINAAILRATFDGKWDTISEPDRIKAVVGMCKALNIPTPLNPFRFIPMKGRLTLYATKEAADLLAQRNALSVNILNKYLDRESNLYVVEVRASTRDGRTVDNLAAMSVAGKSGEDRANVMMKTVTKAHRRAIFSAVGLSIMGEEDLEEMRKGESNYAAPPPAQPPIVTQVITGIPEKDPDVVEETTKLRAELLTAVLAIHKKPGPAKEWIKAKAGKSFEFLSADECVELLALLEDVGDPDDHGKQEPKEDLPF